MTRNKLIHFILKCLWHSVKRKNITATEQWGGCNMGNTFLDIKWQKPKCCVWVTEFPARCLPCRDCIWFPARRLSVIPQIVGSSQTAAGRFHPFRIASTIVSTPQKNQQRATPSGRVTSPGRAGELYLPAATVCGGRKSCGPRPPLPAARVTWRCPSQDGGQPALRVWCGGDRDRYAAAWGAGRPAGAGAVEGAAVAAEGEGAAARCRCGEWDGGAAGGTCVGSAVFVSAPAGYSGIAG